MTDIFLVGHYGDATNLLRALVESPLKNVLFYAIFDPAAALKAQQVGVGNSADLTVGGNTDPSAGGGPLLLREARVVALTDGCFQVNFRDFSINSTQLKAVHLSVCWVRPSGRWAAEGPGRTSVCLRC